MQTEPVPAEARRAVQAVIFDLDGVLTDTAELHYQSWKLLADELGIPFNRRLNEQMRGVSRPDSLALLLRGREHHFSDAERRRLLRQKNETYVRLVDRLTPADLYPGVPGLLESLRARGVRVAVASSSRNAGRVVDRLGIRSWFDVVVDANSAPKSKPDPQVFLVTAQRLGVPPHACVVVEDAQAGVAAALTAGMRVIGIGPAQRVAGAHRVVSATSELMAEELIGLGSQ